MQHDLIHLSLFTIQDGHCTGRRIGRRDRRADYQRTLLIRRDYFRHINGLPSAYRDHRINVTSHCLFLEFPDLTSGNLSFKYGTLKGTFTVFIDLCQLLCPCIKEKYINDIEMLCTESTCITLNFFQQAGTLQVMSHRPPRPVICISAHLVTHSIDHSVILATRIPSPNRLSQSALKVSNVFCVNGCIAIFSSRSKVTVTLSAPARAAFSR